MEAPKCKICGMKHYGLCATRAARERPVAVPLQPVKQLQSYHRVWLEAHPSRTTAWLTARLADGFHVHHLNGNHGDDSEDNLLLIDASDHLRLHRKILPVVRGGKTFNRVAYQREYMRKRRAKAKEQK